MCSLVWCMWLGLSVYRLGARGLELSTYIQDRIRGKRSSFLVISAPSETFKTPRYLLSLIHIAFPIIVYAEPLLISNIDFVHFRHRPWPPYTQINTHTTHKWTQTGSWASICSISNLPKTRKEVKYTLYHRGRYKKYRMPPTSHERLHG